MAQQQLACAECQDQGDDDMDGTCGRSRSETCSARARNEHEQHAEDGHNQSAEHFQQHIPMTRQKKGGHEVSVQKPLIGNKRAHEKCSSDGCERDFGDHTRYEILESLLATFRRHTLQASPRPFYKSTGYPRASERNAVDTIV